MRHLGWCRYKAHPSADLWLALVAAAIAFVLFVCHTLTHMLTLLITDIYIHFLLFILLGCE